MPLAVQVSNLSGVSQVAAGNSFALALKSDGTVWTWGDDTFGQLGTGSHDTLAHAMPNQAEG